MALTPGNTVAADENVNFNSQENYFLLCLYGCNWDDEEEGDSKLPDTLISLLLWEVILK